MTTIRPVSSPLTESSLLERMTTFDLKDVLALETLLQALLASVVFAAAAVCVRALIFTLRKFLTHDRLYGRWHHHFINLKNGKPVFRHERIKIRPGFFKKMIFVTDSPDRPNGHYVGEVIEEKGFVLLQSAATDDDERILQRFLMSAEAGEDVFVGVSCPQDYDGYPSVHACILAKREFTQEDFLRIVKASIQVNDKYRIMTVKGIHGV